MKINNRGFALPTTVLLVTVLTVMLAAAFTRSSSEHQIADGAQFQEEALSIAESGLQRFMESTTSRPSDGDSVRFNSTGGYAWVFVHSLQTPADQYANETFMISSTGYVIETSQGSTPVAEHTVGQMAFWQTGIVLPSAAFTAANGIRNWGNSNTTISGNYYSTDTNGLRIPSTPTLTNMSLSGSPSSIVTGGGVQGTALDTGVDWQRILDGDFECENTSIFSGSFNFNFESYCIEGDLNLQKYYGSGLLIVKGELTVTGKWGYAYWYGPILVGGRIMFEAPQTRFYGAVVSGLDEQVPALPTVLRTHLGNSGKNVRIRYYRPYIETSLDFLTGLVPIGNTWIDNWATY